MRLILLAAILGVVGGVITLVAGHPRPAQYGWFAYAPLADTTFVPQGGYLLSTTSLIGSVVLGTGLMALAFWCGLRLGRRNAHLK